MPANDGASLVAVLGPTNTGKTHLAVERMCGHSSGMIGFPLRLLAREIYDRVVAIKGARSVALVTGEEKILPPEARYFLCTVEAMPVLSGRPARPADGPSERDFAFVAVDEAQLGADPERGHVFTDRLLRARGREETMILGSDMLRPVLRKLLPEAETIARPRFSTLSYAGAKKLSRLPPRSAIVAFSAEEVYAVAEMMRRTRGGAAVVMGALSPRTRNAQVAMFQSGEVDYLVATDAVGMGLNMDVAHVAFASLRKFDGRRERRLTVAEMAQIAGRAGRHHRDGTFGTLVAEGEGAFTPEEIEAIEGHRFPPLEHLFWREGAPSLDSVDVLIADLERRPTSPVLRPAPEAVDLAVLRRLAAEDWVRGRARGTAQVRRLWAACGLPDFQKTGAEPHSRLVGRIYGHLSEGDGFLPAKWIAEEIARLDNVQGDIATLAQRLAGIRTWAYVAQRPDWLAQPAEMAARAQALEERLSDALHQSLTQRFVDRRTAVLMRDLGKRGGEALPVVIGADNAVTVDGEAIGHLDGFHFRPDPSARRGDARMLLAAGERRLARELSRRARALVDDGDGAFTLITEAGAPIAIAWQGGAVATLARGKALTTPRVVLHRALDKLAAGERSAITARLDRWIAHVAGRTLRPLMEMAAAVADATTPAALRAILAPLTDAGGVLARQEVARAVAGLDRDGRRSLGKLGLVLGALDLFHTALLKPEALRWRLALLAARAGEAMPPAPPVGATTLDLPDEPVATAWTAAGYRRLGDQMLRVDLVERIARATHDQRGRAAAAGDGRRTRIVPDPALPTSIGLRPDPQARLLRLLGFREVGDGGPGWAWHGQRTIPNAGPPRPGNPFAALAAAAAAKVPADG